jgi:hypothetical protein
MTGLSKFMKIILFLTCNSLEKIQSFLKNQYFFCHGFHFQAFCFIFGFDPLNLLWSKQEAKGSTLVA